MLEGALYLLSSFWLGAVHAATPGHGKTVSAAYLVGSHGHPSDALALGIFVTLAHTSGIVIFALLAALGSTVISQRGEAYLSFGAALLMVGVGIWMLLGRVRERHHSHSHPHWHADRPSWTVLLGLGIAGGLLPDPAALAVLLAALGSGKLVLGLLTVLVFSLGFASVLVLVGAVVGQAGRVAFGRLTSRFIERVQVATALLITVVGIAMSFGAWQQLAAQF